MNILEVIVKPVVTEKSNLLKDTTNTYVFEVSKKADKPSIRTCVEKMFKVKVKTVRTLTQRGKAKKFGQSTGQSKAFKKAYVTLSEGKIELFEGV